MMWACLPCCLVFIGNCYHAFVCFLVNVIVVLDQERVYNDLKKQFGNKVQIVHLPKSGGVRVGQYDVIFKERTMAFG